MTYHKESPKEVLFINNILVRINLFDNKRNKWSLCKYMQIYKNEKG